MCHVYNGAPVLLQAQVCYIFGHIGHNYFGIHTMFFWTPLEGQETGLTVLMIVLLGHHVDGKVLQCGREIEVIDATVRIEEERW